jgi:hypothetical protein
MAVVAFLVVQISVCIRPRSMISKGFVARADRTQIFSTRVLGLVVCVALMSCEKPSDTPHKSFGDRQIDQMLDDRPEMVGVLRADDPIRRWVAAGMNGERIGQRIYWNGDSPHGGAPSEHARAYAYYPPHISISGGTEVTPTDKWACAVFELFNLENTKEFTDLEAKAIGGDLDRDGYGRSCANLEYVAMRKAQKFFAEHPISNTISDSDKLLTRVVHTPDTFEKYLATYQDSAGNTYDPGEYFKAHYDYQIAPLVKKNDKAAK